MILDVELPLNLHGTDWEVHCGYVDHLILEGKYDDAVKEAREGGPDTVAWVVYEGLRVAEKFQLTQDFVHYSNFVKRMMET